MHSMYNITKCARRIEPSERAYVVKAPLSGTSGRLARDRAPFSGKSMASMIQRVLPEGQNVYGVARPDAFGLLNYKKSLN